MIRIKPIACKAVILALSMALPCISGCASMNSSFDCPMKAGHRCQSLDQVNASVDQGEFAEKMPDRHKEAVQRIWVAPFEDSEGSYHGASDVFASMQGSV